MPTDVAPVNEDGLPAASDIKAVLLGGLFLLAMLVLLAMLAACYVAAEIGVTDRARLRAQPRAAAGDANARADPSAARDRGHAHDPGAVWHAWRVGAVLSVPATSWAQKLPTGVPKLEERLSFLSRPIAAFQKFVDQAQGLTQGDEPKAVPALIAAGHGV